MNCHLLIIQPYNLIVFYLPLYLSFHLSVDTILLFFRAYYNEDGVIVYELRRIARNYVFSGRFFVHLLASAPLQVRTYKYYVTTQIHTYTYTHKLALLFRLFSLCSDCAVYAGQEIRGS